VKTTINIPEKTLQEAMRHTGAKTKREAIVTAVDEYNRRRRLAELNTELKGTFVDFMTQEDLKAMREDAKWAKTV
jgi:Arc/MetJ family transcription regulator